MLHKWFWYTGDIGNPKYKDLSLLNICNVLLLLLFVFWNIFYCLKISCIHIILLDQIYPPQFPSSFSLSPTFSSQPHALFLSTLNPLSAWVQDHQLDPWDQSLKKTDSPSPRSQQLPIAPRLGMGLSWVLTPSTLGFWLMWSCLGLEHL